MEGIRLDHVSKIYSHSKKNVCEVLDQINLHIEPGEFVSLTGESGSGKSSLARLVLGLEPPTSGDIFIDEIFLSGQAMTNRKKLYSRVQAVFQDAGGTLNSKLSVYQNVEESLVNLTTLNREQRRERIHNLMEMLLLDVKLLKTQTGKLSGGEQRRLSLLRALAIQPKYLVLDEVVSGLDLISKSAVLSLLKTYRESFDCGCLFITHDLSAAAVLSDRVLRIEGGRITKVAVVNQTERYVKSG